MNTSNVSLHLQLYQSPRGAHGVDTYVNSGSDVQSKLIHFCLMLNDSFSTIISPIDVETTDLNSLSSPSLLSSIDPNNNNNPIEDSKALIHEVTNAARNGQDENIVLFKIQSTQSNRYKVRPAEGLLSLRKRRDVIVSLSLRPVDDINLFMNDVKGKDVLLVRSLKIPSSVLRMALNSADNDTSKALKDVWTRFGDRSERLYVPIAFTVIENETAATSEQDKEDNSIDSINAFLQSILPSNKDPNYIMHLLMKNWSTLPQDRLSPDELRELKIVRDNSNPSQWERLQQVSRERLLAGKLNELPFKSLSDSMNQHYQTMNLSQSFVSTNSSQQIQNQTTVNPNSNGSAKDQNSGLVVYNEDSTLNISSISKNVELDNNNNIVSIKKEINKPANERRKSRPVFGIPLMASASIPINSSNKSPQTMSPSFDLNAQKKRSPSPSKTDDQRRKSTPTIASRPSLSSSLEAKKKVTGILSPPLSQYSVETIFEDVSRFVYLAPSFEEACLIPVSEIRHKVAKEWDIVDENSFDLLYLGVPLSNRWKGTDFGLKRNYFLEIKIKGESKLNIRKLSPKMEKSLDLNEVNPISNFFVDENETKNADSLVTFDKKADIMDRLNVSMNNNSDSIMAQNNSSSNEEIPTKAPLVEEVGSTKIYEELKQTANDRIGLIEKDTANIREELSKLQNNIDTRLQGLENEIKITFDEKIASAIDDMVSRLESVILSFSEERKNESAQFNEKLSLMNKSMMQSNDEAKKQINDIKDQAIIDCKAINTQSIASISIIEERTNLHLKRIQENMEQEIKTVKEISINNINRMKDEIQVIQNQVNQSESKLAAQIEDRYGEVKTLIATINENQQQEATTSSSSVAEGKLISLSESKSVNKTEDLMNFSAISNPSDEILVKTVEVEVYGLISPTWATTKLSPSGSKTHSGIVTVVKDENIIRISEQSKQESGKMFLLDHVYPSNENIVQELMTDFSSVIDEVVQGDICSILLCGDSRSGKGLIIDGFEPIDPNNISFNDSLNSPSLSAPKQKGSKIVNREGISFYLIRHLFRELKSKVDAKVFMSYEFIDQNDKIFNILDNKNEIDEEFAKKEIKSFADYMKVKSEADIMLTMSPHQMFGHKILTIIVETQSDVDTFKRGAIRLVDLIGMDVSSQSKGLLSFSKYPQSNPRYGIWPSLPSKLSNANNRYHTIVIATLHPQLPHEAIQTLNFIEGFRQFLSGNFATIKE